MGHTCGYGKDFIREHRVGYYRLSIREEGPKERGNVGLLNKC